MKKYRNLEFKDIEHLQWGDILYLETGESFFYLAKDILQRGKIVVSPTKPPDYVHSATPEEITAAAYQVKSGAKGVVIGDSRKAVNNFNTQSRDPSTFLMPEFLAKQLNLTSGLSIFCLDWENYNRLQAGDRFVSKDGIKYRITKYIQYGHGTSRITEVIQEDDPSKITKLTPEYFDFSGDNYKVIGETAKRWLKR